MPWHDHPEWAAFRAAVAAAPDDDTTRLVAADWLNDKYPGEDTAETRAALIREQVHVAQVLPGAAGRWIVHGTDDPAGLPPDRSPAPEADLRNVAAVELHRGFVRTVRFWPWRFLRTVVAPVMRLNPVARVELAVCLPAWRQTSPEYPWVCHWVDGPGVMRSGETRNTADLVAAWVSDGGSWSEAEPFDVMLAAWKSRGVNPTEMVYRLRPNRLPHHVYAALPRLSEVDRDDTHPTVAAALEVAGRAAWCVARRWADLPAAAPLPPAPERVAGGTT